MGFTTDRERPRAGARGSPARVGRLRHNRAVRFEQSRDRRAPDCAWRVRQAAPLRSLLLPVVPIAIVLASCAGASTSGLERLPLRGVSECALSDLDGIGPLDVAVVIDASRSTRNPTESDIDGDGVVGRFADSVMTDPDDTLLSAQVAGVRSLLHAASGPGRRFAIVSFSGRFRFGPRAPPDGLVLRAQAVVHSELTEDLGSLEVALNQILEKGSFGTTDFAAGLRKALRALSEAAPPGVPNRRIVLFLSDATTPLVPRPNEKMLRIDPLIQVAALRAIDAGVRVHTFGLGEAAAAPPPHVLSQIAGATGGTYRGVSDPVALHCYLLHALVL